MALGDPYVTAAALKTYLRITDSTDDTEITAAVNEASREIEKWCGRQFNTAASATARTYFPTGCDEVVIDDFSTTTGLVVKTDEDGDGVYETTWTISTDFIVLPLNGVVDGESGWPYWQIRAVGSRRFRYSDLRPPLEVTALWGWTAVPTPVVQAAKILAAETFKMSESPFGVAGTPDFGVVRLRENTAARAKVSRYRRDAVLVG